MSALKDQRAIWPAFVCESLSSVGSSLLMVGVFFYTQRYFGWGLKQNFLLAMGQGAGYAVASLLAHPLAERLGQRRALVAVYAILVLTAIIPLIAPWRSLVLGALLFYGFIVAVNWPILENLVSAGSDAHAMSRRIGVYNLVWAATNAVVFAASGAIIQHWPAGLFVIPAIVHAASGLLILASTRIEPHEQAGHGAVAEPEPELLASRTLAMWLARIALPSTYVVIYSLMAMMPSLPVMEPLTTAQRTLVGSVWMAARGFAFLALGATVWWHRRPRLLLLAAAIMLIAFLGVTVQPSVLIAVPYATDLASMLLWQVILGVAMGLIYAGSLYFGMVLSQGSTEHGGYHEALIGLGSVLGPGAGAMTQLLGPRSPYYAVAAVSGVIALTVLAAAIKTLRFRLARRAATPLPATDSSPA